MKILIVTPHYYPEQFKITEIAEKLALEHDVTVWTNIPNYPFGKYFVNYGVFKRRLEVINKVQVVRLFEFSRGSLILSLLLNYISNFVSSVFRSIFNRKKFDIVLSYQLSPITAIISGVIVSKRQKIPHMIYVQDLWPDSLKVIGIRQNTIVYRAMNKFSDLIYSSATQLIVSSEMFVQYFTDKKINDAKYVPNFSEQIFENTYYFEDSLNPFNSKNINFLFTGNVGKAQNLDHFLEIANLLKTSAVSNIVFNILGNGSYKQELTGKIYQRNLEDYFNFLPQVEINEVPKFIYFADILFASLSFDSVISKTLPSKIQSYLASNKPIFAIGTGEMYNILNKFEGCICIESEKVEEQYEGVLKILKYKDFKLNNSVLYNRLFSRDMLINRINDLLKELYNEYNC
jgi:glycosyltransferase involved in cell wall biosynthesis